MSTQFIFSKNGVQLASEYSNLLATIIFNKDMVQHYSELTAMYRKNRHYREQFFCWYRMKMYQRKLKDAQLTEFLNQINRHHHGPAITISA